MLQYIKRELDDSESILRYTATDCTECEKTRVILSETWEMFACDIIIDDHKCGMLKYQTQDGMYGLCPDWCEVREFWKSVCWKFFCAVYEDQHYHLDELVYWKFFNNAIIRTRGTQKLKDYWKFYLHNDYLYKAGQDENICNMLHKHNT